MDGINHNRIKLAMIMFLFASPISSIVRLCLLLYQNYTGDTDTITHLNMADATSEGGPTPTPSLVELLNNATIEEIIQSIISSQFGLHASPLHAIASASALTNHATLKMHVIHHDLQRVLPWIFIVFIFFISPFMMAFMNRAHMARHGVYPGEIAEREQRKKTFAKTVRRLVACLENYQVVSSYFLHHLCTC